MSKRVLVIASHADDEALGCAGTMAKHVAANDEVHLLIMSDGVTSRSYDPDKLLSYEDEVRINADLIKRRKTETIASAHVLGIPETRVYFLDLLNLRMDTYPLLAVVKFIEKYKKLINPHVVYTNYYGDMNIDHRITAEAVLVAFARLSGETLEALYLFEVPESTSLAVLRGASIYEPNHYVDISSFIELKIKALEAYESEARDYPHMRSVQYIRELSQRRGEAVGMACAEGFIKLK